LTDTHNIHCFNSEDFDQYSEEENDMQDPNAKTCDEASQSMNLFNRACGPNFPNFTTTMHAFHMGDQTHGLHVS